MNVPASGVCGICGHNVEPAFQLDVMGTIPADFQRCPHCEYVFAANPHWLDSAHREQAIASLDTGVAARNVIVSRYLIALYAAHFPDGPYVDWASGWGLLVRLLRDAGFEATWQDVYAPNLFARGFEWDGRPAQIVSLVEALEHTPTPVEFLQECLTLTGAGSIVFTQELHPGHVRPDWHYLVPMTGQHVSFYSPRTLRVLAEKLDRRVLSFGTLHLFTDRQDLSQRQFASVVRQARVRSAWARRHRPALTLRDHDELADRLRRDQP